MESMVDDTHDSRDEKESEDEAEEGESGEKQPFRGTFCWPRGLKKVACERGGGGRGESQPQPAEGSSRA